MSKRSAKIAATYFLTIIISLVLIGGGGYLVISKYLNSSSDKSSIDNIVIDDGASQNAEYSPVFGDGRTVLFIYEAEKSQTSTSFLLARFAPADNKAVLVPLQTDIACELDGTANTLYEFYRLGGTSSAKRAVEKFTGLTVDRYLKFTKDSSTPLLTLWAMWNTTFPTILFSATPPPAKARSSRAAIRYLTPTPSAR